MRDTIDMGLARLGVYLTYTVYAIYSVIAVMILFLVSFGYSSLENPYGLRPKYALPMPVFFVVALLFVVLLTYALLKYSCKGGNSYCYVLPLLSVAVLVFQNAVIRYTPYVANWDPDTIFNYAVAAVRGGDLGAFQPYFDMFPNNYGLAVLMQFLVRVSFVLKLDPAMFTASVGALGVNLGCLILALGIGSAIGKACIVYTSWIIATILGSLSFWIGTPYTDTFLFPFVATVISLYLIYRNSAAPITYIVLVVMVFSAFVGSLFKPTVLVLVVALVIDCILRYARREGVLKDILCIFLSILVSVTLIYGVASPLLKKHLHVNPNPEMAFSYQHYLMMGANPQSYGAFNLNDVKISAGIPDKTDRQAKDLDVALRRLQAMNADSAIHFYAVKLVTTYGDGTFGIGHEGKGFPEVPSERNLPNSLKKLYYMENNTPSVFGSLQQLLWMILLLCAALLLPRKNTDDYAVFLRLSFIGLTCFLMLFETRARYLYSFLPIFVVIFAVSLDRIVLQVNAVLVKRGIVLSGGMGDE